MIEFYDHQKNAIDKLESGSILCGGVGSGKSRTALGYYIIKDCKGNINKDGLIVMKEPKNLFIITTARKRDTLEWERECAPFLLSTKKELSIYNIKVTIDSWNNIKKYTDIKDSFFIFDEQRVVGYGAWVKSFLKIVKNNTWILLTATPGDTWMDYVPVFIANGFYKNKTEFIKRHVVYSRFSKYPKIDHYIDCNRLIKIRQKITVDMPYVKKTISHVKTVLVPFDKDKVNYVMVNRWNIFEKKPIKDASELCYLLRKIVNSDPNRLSVLDKIIETHLKVIIFYNFNYELELLREKSKELNIPYAEWNGHKHEKIPNTNKWIYLVQYTAGAEGWNCVETNTVVFFSQNYSYKIMTQAAGRIDRINTPYIDLYYYHIRSSANIDLAILKALKNKQTFNANRFTAF